MNRSQLVAIADAVRAIRPDWQQPGIISQLAQLDQTWTGTDAALASHALTIAGTPTARTPAAFNATPPAATQPQTQTWTSQRREPTCYTCSRSRSQCQAVRDHEIAHGVADPHRFETAEQAEANRSVTRRTLRIPDLSIDRPTPDRTQP